VRVAFLVPRFPVVSETFVLNQATGVLDRGHELDIYAFGPGDAPALWHPDAGRYGLMDRVRFLPRVPRRRTRRAWTALGLMGAAARHGSRALGAMGRSLNVLKYGREALSLSLLYVVAPLLGRGGYDIIHCQFGHLGRLGLQLREIGAAGRLVVSYRGSDISAYVKKHGDRVYDDVFASGDIFVPNCEYFSRRLVSLGCDAARIAVLRTGIDCGRFPFTAREPAADGIVRIGFIGRLVEKKGVEYLVHAISRLVRGGARLECSIVGSGPLRESLQRLVLDLDLGSVVTLFEAAPQPEVVRFLQRFHIFVAPSVTAGDGDEDAPTNVLKEAMATGLPVLTTYHGGIPEVVEDGVSGFLTPERDIGALTDRLGLLARTPALWAAMGRAGRVRVEKDYNLSNLNDELVALYRRALQQPAAPRRPARAGSREQQAQ
jgi:colanic acid/amylovoran biosynthesis glycosyltransferase